MMQSPGISGPDGLGSLPPAGTPSQPFQVIGTSSVPLNGQLNLVPPGGGGPRVGMLGKGCGGPVVGGPVVGGCRPNIIGKGPPRGPVVGGPRPLGGPFSFGGGGLTGLGSGGPPNMSSLSGGLQSLGG